MWQDTIAHKILPYCALPCICLVEGEPVPLIATYFTSGFLVGTGEESLPAGWYYFLAGTSDRRYVLLVARVLYWMYVEEDPRNGINDDTKVTEQCFFQKSKEIVRRQWNYK